jgi:hypothetical protein
MITPAQLAMEEVSRQTYLSHQKLSEKIRPVEWTGKRCFIVGGGPSLKGFDFSRLRGERVIGINRSFEFVQTDLLYFMDHSFYRDVHELESWKRFSGVRVAPSPLSQELKFDASVHLVWRRMGIGLHRGIEEGVYAGTNSGLGALMLAATLGCNPIYLFGYDMSTDGGTHWHSGYKNQAQEAMSLLIRDYIRDFVQVSSVFTGTGIKIVNLNKQSGLHCFPKMDPDEVLG